MRVGAGANALKDANLGALTDGGGLKTVLVVLRILEVAQGAHHHGSGLNRGDGVQGAVGAVSVAGDNLVGVAGAHIGLRPGGDVPEGTAGLVILVVQLQQIGHNNSHLCAGDGPVRLKVASVGVADHDLNGLKDLDGLDVVVVIGNVGEARSTGSDNHHAQEHNGSQGQAESPLQVSHSDFLLTNLFGLRGAVLGRNAESHYYHGSLWSLTFLQQNSAFCPKISRFFNFFGLPPPCHAPCAGIKSWKNQKGNLKTVRFRIKK